MICSPVQAASRSWATALHFTKTIKGRHIQQSFPLSKVLPLSAVTPLCFSLLGLIIPFASLYHVLASSFFHYLTLLVLIPSSLPFIPPPHLTFFFLLSFSLASSLSLSHSRTPLTLAFLCQMWFLSVSTEFVCSGTVQCTHWYKEARQTQNSLELKLAGKTVS